METAAAIAPEAPAISTVLVSLVVAATPKIKPKMETVPSSIPKTIVPAELVNELRNRCRIKLIFIRSHPPLLIWIPPQGLAERGSGVKLYGSVAGRSCPLWVKSGPSALQRKAHIE